MGEAYSCASGGVIHAGRFSAPGITNYVWTPARDGNGNVISSDWAGLPLNIWLDVAGGVLNDVIQTPHLLTAAGADGAGAIVAAWSGAAWDAANNRMYLSGGGHGDSHCCETGIYMVDTASLKFSRVADRQPVSQQQGWNGTAFVDTNSQAPYSIPLKNGVPSSWHTYNGNVFIPPSVMGNTNGGVFTMGSARSTYNLDTHTYSTTHWNTPEHDSLDWSNQAAFLDGHVIYAPLNSWFHQRFDLSQSEVTDWSATSSGKWLSGITSNVIISSNEQATWGVLSERREEVCFRYGGSRVRLRYGQAIDANAADWTPYFDTITLTSSDGSHLDFNDINQNVNAKLGQPGFCYDHVTGALYLVSSTAGGEVYKLTGIASNTWNVEKMVGTGVRRVSHKGAYGRVRMANIAGTKVLIRVSTTTTPIEVMRIS